METNELYYVDYPHGTVATNESNAYFRRDDGWKSTSGKTYPYVAGIVTYVPKPKVKVGETYTREQLSELTVPTGTVIVKNISDGGVAWQYSLFDGWISAGNQIQNINTVSRDIQFKIVFVGA